MPDGLLGWFSSGNGVVFVAIVSFVTSLIASAIIEAIKARFSKKVESHKFNLKRAELFFEREVQAANDFVTLRERLMPQQTPNCDDWDTACREFAHRFQSVESELKEYLLKHSVVLDFANRERINKFVWSAGERKFEMLAIDDEPSAASIKEADEILTGMRELEISLIGNLKVPKQ